MTYSNEDSWKLVQLYFKKKYLSQLIKHQLESYNNFTNMQLEKTISMFNPIIIHSENDYDKELQQYNLEIQINIENVLIYRAHLFENNGSTKIMHPTQALLKILLIHIWVIHLLLLLKQLKISIPNNYKFFLYKIYNEIK